MSTLDIREKETPVTEIQYDDSARRIYVASHSPTYVKVAFGGVCDPQRMNLVKVEDIDNLIKALEKAKELWGRK